MPDVAEKATPQRTKALRGEDTITLLRAAVDFRSRTGATPTRSTVGSFRDAVRSSLPADFTGDHLLNKLRHLRHKFNTSSKPPSTDHDRLVFELSALAFGSSNNKNGVPISKKIPIEASETKGAEDDDDEGEEEEEEDDDDEGGMQGGHWDPRALYPYLMSAMEKLCGMNGSEVEMVEKSLKFVDTENLGELERKFHELCRVEMELVSQEYELQKQLLQTVLDFHEEPKP